MKNQKGFSLLEFLMSLFIVFVLTTIGYTQYVSSWENAKQSAVKANMHTIQLCAEDYATRADGVYPGGINTPINAGDSTVLAGTNKPPYPVKAVIPNNFINPVDSTHDAIRTGVAKKPFGCVYYCGLNSSGVPMGETNPAVAYKITAMGPYRPITLVLTSSGFKKGTSNEKK